MPTKKKPNDITRLNCPVNEADIRKFKTMARAMGLTEAAFAQVIMRKGIKDAWDTYKSAEKNLVSRSDGYSGRARHPELMKEYAEVLHDPLPRPIKSLSEVLNDPGRRPFMIRDIEGTFRTAPKLTSNHYPRTAWEYWDGAKWEQLHDTAIAFTITVNIKKGQARYMGDDPWMTFTLAMQK